MADVFISYKSEDRAAAKLYAEALAAEGVSVWWDPVLRTGETYDEVIERNLREAALVVVLWSPRSVKSKWVRAEATIGERKGGLMPVLIEACERPIAFELTQTADLCGWGGDRSDARWRSFMGDLRSALVGRQRDAAAHVAPPAPDASTLEDLFWDSIKDSGERADFALYLKRYPHGRYVALARDSHAYRKRPLLLALWALVLMAIGVATFGVVTISFNNFGETWRLPQFVLYACTALMAIGGFGLWRMRGWGVLLLVCAGAAFGYVMVAERFTLLWGVYPAVLFLASVAPYARRLRWLSL